MVNCLDGDDQFGRDRKNMHTSMLTCAQNELREVDKQVKYNLIPILVGAGLTAWQLLSKNPYEPLVAATIAGGLSGLVGMVSDYARKGFILENISRIQETSAT